MDLLPLYMANARPKSHRNKIKDCYDLIMVTKRQHIEIIQCLKV